MELRLLGEVAVLVGDRRVDLGPARQRCVWVALAVDVNRVVSVERLTERVWDVGPPLRARSTVLTYLSRLRQVLADVDGVELFRRSGGYLLAVDVSAVDLLRFRDLCARARAADDTRAARLLSEALDLWRGEPLTGVTGEWSETERERLRLERLDVRRDLVDTRLRLGEGGELVGDLAVEAAEHPLDDRVAGQYLLALHQSGRVADALEHYQRHRARLAEMSGMDPGGSLRELHRRILASDPALDPAAHLAPTGTPVTVPRQLPAAPTAFAGRQDDLRRLDAVSDASSGAMVVIAGGGGLGKTWLALHWAHLRLERFPDGQLFVDLRGFGTDGQPMEAATAVRGFLEALGVRQGAVPTDPHAQSALFRSLVADKRMLVLLDNAAGSEQVVPLLPGGGTCTVLVTSRNHLPGLITGHAVHHLAPDVLTDDEARAALAGRLGVDRVAAEPTAVDAIVGSCAGLPLALGIIAGRAQIRPRLPLAALAAELAESGLGALEVEPAVGLPAVLSWSHRALAPEQAGAFALIGIAPGPDIGLPAASALLGRPMSETRAVLRGVEHASLLEQDAEGRYRMHDLVRQYAAGVPVRDGEAALRRVVEHHVRTAAAASRLVAPNLGDPTRGLDRPRHPGERLTSREQAWAWYHRERLCVLAVQRTAADLGEHRAAHLVERHLYPFQYMTAAFEERVAACRTALRSALELDDPAVLGDAHRFLGSALCEAGALDEGVGHLRTALALAEDLGDGRCLSGVHMALVLAWSNGNRHEEALRGATRAIDVTLRSRGPLQVARVRAVAAHSAAHLDRHDLAISLCEAVLPVLREHPDRDIEANALATLGHVAVRTGDARRAVALLRTSAAMFREEGNTRMVADTLDRLGTALRALGRRDQARDQWEVAASLYRAQGRTADLDRVLEQLGADVAPPGRPPARRPKSF
ncbi:BTAD domain-containing putative transcriptional regulator [Actinosynnema sp. NPDC020468]|uniref:AfsR/SARP family transcriptional regulator n=1 Tax=Actinosynnema sp. NPDC020468 TaxID=3154488 RepID=UPI00340C0FC6